ncbi:hypothetical protein V5799_022842, partial [Amblyomma americanum]
MRVVVFSSLFVLQKQPEHFPFFALARRSGHAMSQCVDLSCRLGGKKDERGLREGCSLRLQTVPLFSEIQGLLVFLSHFRPDEGTAGLCA